MEASRPEIWPGARPWADPHGSFGTLPDAEGLGASVMRLRVPPEKLADFMPALLHRYPKPPRFSVGPFETPGLREWLSEHDYVCEMVETVLVLPRDSWPHGPGAGPVVREALNLADLLQTLRLDQIVFDEPLRTGAGLRREWARYGGHRRLFLAPGDDGTARASGVYTDFGRWILLSGAVTHPGHRRQGLYHAVVQARIDAARTSSAASFAAVYANQATSAPILEHLGFQAIGTVTAWAPSPG